MLLDTFTLGIMQRLFCSQEKSRLLFLLSGCGLSDLQQIMRRASKCLQCCWSSMATRNIRINIGTQATSTRSRRRSPSDWILNYTENINSSYTRMWSKIYHRFQLPPPNPSALLPHGILSLFLCLFLSLSLSVSLSLSLSHTHTSSFSTSLVFQHFSIGICFF